MHAISFIQDLAVIMLVAGVVTVLFHRFKQPVVLGYIVAGFIIGPHTPPFGLIHDEETIKTLAELGVIFLMFCLGLEFSLRKLFKVGATAFIAAFLEIVLMIWIGYEIGRWFDWNTMDSLFLGAILAISSTTIIVKALNDLKMKNERFAQLIFGVLIVEDILGIGIIALLSSIAVSGTVSSGEVFSTVGKLSLFMIVALVIGILAGAAIAGLRGQIRKQRNAADHGAGLVFWLLPAGGQARIQHGARRVPDRCDHGRIPAIAENRALDRAGSRPVQRDLLRRHRPDARPDDPAAVRLADCGDHRRRSVRQDVVLRPRGVYRRQ
jgi:NhaP-type Na+/H+ or K+/H+ antiporter